MESTQRELDTTKESNDSLTESKAKLESDKSGLIDDLAETEANLQKVWEGKKDKEKLISLTVKWFRFSLVAVLVVKLNGIYHLERFPVNKSPMIEVLRISRPVMYDLTFTSNGYKYPCKGWSLDSIFLFET